MRKLCMALSVGAFLYLFSTVGALENGNIPMAVGAFRMIVGFLHMGVFALAAHSYGKGGKHE